MKVGIYAFYDTAGANGGTSHYLTSLIRHLGRLTDGPEEYVIVAMRGCEDWFRAVCGPNQRVVSFTAAKAGLARRVYNRLWRLSHRLPMALRPFRDSEFDLASDPFDSTRHTPAALSTGKLEALDLDLIHFPFQQYIVTSIPSVFNPHDLQHLHLPQYFSPQTQLARELTYPFACRLANRVVVAADWVARDVSERYAVSREKIAVIPWGAATSGRAEPNPAQLATVRRKYDLPEQFCFYPAVTWPHKNHSRLIQAIGLLAKRGNRVSLVFTGSTTPLTGRLYEQARAAGLSDAVRFLGAVPGDEMRSLYRLATAAAIPTLFEALSGPVAEAWNDDLPVACSDIPQLSEQVGEAAILFDPRNPEAIAQAIQRLLSEPDLRSRLIQKGRERLAQFDWATTAKRYRDVYRECVAGCAKEPGGGSGWKL